MATQAAKATAPAAAPAGDKKADSKADPKGAAAAADPGKKGAAVAAAGAGDPKKARLRLKFGKKTLIILLAIVMLIAGAAGGVLYFRSRPPADAADTPDKAGDAKGEKKAADKKTDAKKEAKKDGKKDDKKDEKKKKIEYISGDPYYTVNLADEDNDRFLQLGLVFEMSDPKATEELKEKMPAVRSKVLYLLSTKHSRELMAVEGKKQLASEILAIARQALDGPPPDNAVEAVDFSVFVIQ